MVGVVVMGRVYRSDRTAFESKRRLSAVSTGGCVASAGAESALVLLRRGDGAVLGSLNAEGQLLVHDEFPALDR